MCRPSEKPIQKTVDTPLPQTPKPTSSSFWTKSACIVAFIVVCFPCLVSELIGGWTKQYTSPLLFPFGHLSIPSQANKVVIVTGANTGIGYETTLKLAQAGAHVIVACRSEAKGLQAMERIHEALGDDSKAQLTFLPLDLASLKNVQAFAQQFKNLNLPLDTLVLNAGVMKSPGAEFLGGQELTYGFDTTTDGLEYHIGVNHVAHFYLTQLLMDSFVPEGGRVVAVSSMAEHGAYDSGMRFQDWKPINGQMPESYEDGKAYGQSKLANLLFARELAVRYNHVSAYSCHPGVIQTELSRYMAPFLESEIEAKPFVERHLSTLLGKWFEQSFFSAQSGALTQLHLATADVSLLQNGGFYHPVGRPVDPYHDQGSNATLQTLLWEETERVIQELV